MSYQQPPSQPGWTQPQQPAWGPPPPAPQPPRKRGGKVATIGCLGSLAFLILIVIVAAAVDGSGKKDTADNTHASSPARTADEARGASAKPTPKLDQRTLTKLSVGIAWEGYSESRKDLMCAGIETYGTDWAADQMRQGSKNRKSDADLDWDYAAELVEAKCAAR